MSEPGHEWYLDEGEAESTLSDVGGGNFELLLDISDAGQIREDLGSMLMGLKDAAHVFINQQPNGSCRLLTLRLKLETS